MSSARSGGGKARSGASHAATSSMSDQRSVGRMLQAGHRGRVCTSPN